MDAPRGSRRSLAALMIAPLAVLTCACSGSSSQSSPAPEETAPSVTLEHVSTIGCDGCDDERQVTPVTLAILDDERIAVLDAYEPFVRVFGVDGALRQSYGSKGEGPGELGMPLPPAGYLPGMWLFGNDLGGVTVLELMPASLEAFDAEGAFVDSTDTGLPMAVPTAQAFDPETRTYYRIAFMMSPAGNSQSIVRCRFSAADPGCEDFADPAPFIRQDEAPDARVGTLAVAAAPGGALVVTNAATYDVWRLDDGGAVAMHTRREIPLPMKSEAEMERAREAAARAGQADREIDPRRAHIEPYGAQVDGAGRIWVLTGRYRDSDSVFDVFAADGSYIDEVVIDAAVRRTDMGQTLFVTRVDLLVVVAQRDDGNQEIRVYRIHAQ